MDRKTTAVRSSLRVIALAAATLASTGAFAQRAPVTSNMPAGALPSSWDASYGVCRGVDPKCYSDWGQTRQNRVLIYSRTAGPRHANLGTALPAGKQTQTSATATPSTNITLNANNVAQAKLREWLNAEGIAADITEDVTQLSGLTTYKAVIFLSTTRDTMWRHGSAVQANVAINTTVSAQLDAAKTDLRKYIQGGGGFVGIHNAFGTEYNWKWYEGLLGNANFYDHGANQDGQVRVVGTADSSTAGLPSGNFLLRDEWYNLVPYPTNVKHLLVLDGTSLRTQSSGHPGHGTFHPVSWCQYYDGGRSWVTTLGHDGAAFTDGSNYPNQAAFKKHIVEGIKSAMGLVSFCTK